jgi:uncharacterized protein YjbJ (UPF0337 family)
MVPGLVDRHRHKERHMDWNRVEGNWKQMKGKVKEKWGNLTDDDLAAINGLSKVLNRRAQEREGALTRHH